MIVIEHCDANITYSHVLTLKSCRLCVSCNGDELIFDETNDSLSGYIEAFINSKVCSSKKRFLSLNYSINQSLLFIYSYQEIIIYHK